MWARMSSSENGTAVTTRFMRTTWGTGAVLPSYSARILRASSSHSSLRNGYDGIAVLLRLRLGVVVGAGPRLPRPEPSGRRNPTRLAGRLPVRGCFHSSPVPSPIPRLATPAVHSSCTASPATRSRSAAWRWRWPTPASPSRCRCCRATAPNRGHARHTVEDWSAAAESAYAELAARSDGVLVVGLSMGGMLSVWLAERHPEIAAIAVVNPLLAPPDADTLGFIQAMIDAGDEVAPGIGSDIAMEGAVEAAYPGLPLRAALSLFAARGRGGGGPRLGHLPRSRLHQRAGPRGRPRVEPEAGGPGQGAGRAGHTRAELPRGHAGLGQGRDRGPDGRVRDRRAPAAAREPDRDTCRSSAGRTSYMWPAWPAST